jgi:subtilisin family serine protease
MTMQRWSVAPASVAVALLIASVSGQQPRARAPFAAGEILVKFHPQANATQRGLALASRGASRLRRFAAVDIDLVRIPPGLAIDAAVAAFRAMPAVLLAQPNYTRRLIAGPPPNDPFWLDGSLWGLNKIQAQSAWTNFTAGDGTVVIANIDTGVEYTHPDLAANMWRNPSEIPGNAIDDDGNGYVDDVYGIDTINQDSDPIDDQGHGTHTSGTAAAVGNNGVGVTGVNWNAKVLACKFLSAEGFGTDAGAIECFNYLVALKTRGENIRVSSNSWGSARESGPPAAALQSAIDAAGAVGIINIFGAGNDGMDNDLVPFDPASYTSPSIVAVASSGATDRRSFFSNYGATSVDLAAPGEDILSTYPGASYSESSGTSMATPFVAGVAALVASMNPSLSVPEIKALLLDNVDQSPRWQGVVVSGGRLNALRAASAVGSGPSNTPPTASITSPAEGATFKEPVTITVTADAADSDGTVASVAFYANGSPIGVDATSPYSTTWINVTAGSYTVTAVATDNLGAIGASAGVHVIVVPNAPPIVAISSPAAGASFTSPATVTMTADASDSDGSVTGVGFYANGALIGTDTTSPYGVTWNAPLGAHALTAVATDNAGGSSTSASVSITVDPMPGRINVARAANGGAATASSTLHANYPPAGAINGDRKGLNWGAGGGWNDATQNAFPDWLEVSFNGSKLIEEVNVFSMQDNYAAPIEPTPTTTFIYYGLRHFEVQYWNGASWLPVPGSTVVNNTKVWRQVVFAPLTTSRIRVHITGGLGGYSRAMEVEAWGVASGGNTPPSVAITSPAEGAAFLAPAAIAIAATASDSDDGIQQVAFYANGALVGTDALSPYAFTWHNVAPGSYTLTAVAMDNVGATTTSAVVSVSVAASNVPPSVAIASPAGGAIFTAPASVIVTADALDTDGAVASVTFYANGTPIGIDTSGPYSVTWNTVAAGQYTLTAVAADNLGSTATSAPVPITVAPIPGRINVALAANGAGATASSTYNANYPPAGAINGDRKGLNWGAGGGWNDGTPNTSPDWIEVAFHGTKTIDEVNVFSMQDNYASPIEPTLATTFVYYGLRAFEVQYWNGAAWAVLPGGTVANNNKVWRQIVFAPVTTSRIRVHITGGLSAYSRVMEVEAWGVAAGGNSPPSVALTAPAQGAAFLAPATIAIAAAASDSDDGIQQVAFYANGALIGTDANSPYSVPWTNVGGGVYSLTAVATDNTGATSASPAVSITVAASNTTPSVTLTSPADGATFTAPATIAVAADASDTDGSVASVAFYANGVLIGTATSSPFSIAWSNVPSGAYTVTAVAIDNLGASATSPGVSITVNPMPGRMNVALAANGAGATASSTFNANYPPAGAINGDRRGLNWGAGGGWNDSTQNTFPDWIEVTFNGAKTIDEINVLSMQDNYASPAEPTLAMTFIYYGLRHFEVQYWDGAAWMPVSGGTVTNNTRVWRQFLFAPITTTRIRVHITGGLGGYSRVMEIEAWGVGSDLVSCVSETAVDSRPTFLKSERKP